MCEGGRRASRGSRREDGTGGEGEGGKEKRGRERGGDVREES